MQTSFTSYYSLPEEQRNQVISIPKRLNIGNLDESFIGHQVQQITFISETESLRSQFKHEPSQYELTIVDVLTNSNANNEEKESFYRHFLTETCVTIEYFIYSRMMSDFTHSIINKKLSHFPEGCWRRFLPNITVKNSKRRGIINNQHVSDCIERKIVNIDLDCVGNTPSLATKQWYLKIYKHAHSGEVLKCTVKKATFFWNRRTHELFISFSYKTEKFDERTCTFWNCG